MIRTLPLPIEYYVRAALTGRPLAEKRHHPLLQEILETLTDTFRAPLRQYMAGDDAMAHLPQGQLKDIGLDKRARG